MIGYKNRKKIEKNLLKVSKPVKSDARIRNLHLLDEVKVRK
jgi:hypothetical protein